MNTIAMLTMVAGSVVAQADFDTMKKCTEARNTQIAAQYKVGKENYEFNALTNQNHPLVIKVSPDQMQIACVYKKVEVKVDDGPERVFGLFEGFLSRIERHEKANQTIDKCRSGTTS
jgi:hypothetical protein